MTNCPQLADSTPESSYHDENFAQSFTPLYPAGGDAISLRQPHFCLG